MEIIWWHSLTTNVQCPHCFAQHHCGNLDSVLLPCPQQAFTLLLILPYLLDVQGIGRHHFCPLRMLNSVSPSSFPTNEPLPFSFLSRFHYLFFFFLGSPALHQVLKNRTQWGCARVNRAWSPRIILQEWIRREVPESSSSAFSPCIPGES